MITRASVLVTAAVLVGTASDGLLAAAASDPQVATKQGIVAGTTNGAVRAFLGIPYAAPPVGPLRWKPPRPAANWSGVRPAKLFGRRCMQPEVGNDMVFRDAGISEDCLTLNIWTPTQQARARLPVMVWIYGGGFTLGGSSEPRQDGANLATQGVVVVSMNYRLGILGFLASSALAAESVNHAAGNYALLDQLAALKWVQQNSEAFGGDPSNVTLFGESAGSYSVSAQMASPLAKAAVDRSVRSIATRPGRRARRATRQWGRCSPA